MESGATPLNHKGRSIESTATTPTQSSRGKRSEIRQKMKFYFLIALLAAAVICTIMQMPTWEMANNGYAMYVFSGGVPDLQAFLSSKDEVDQWAAGGDVSHDLLSFIGSTSFETELVFVYTHTHSGSGMDDPIARAQLRGDVLDINWYDQCTSSLRTRDLRSTRLVAAVRLDPNIIKSVHVHGLQLTAHTFTTSNVKDTASAFDILRGLEELKNKSNKELASLTSVSIKKADHSRLLQALAYLPNLQELLTIGIHWRPHTLELLGRLTSLKKLRVGGIYWAKPNNFKYKDLEALTDLSNLESLDMSYASFYGKRSSRRWKNKKGDGNECRDEEEFAKGMRIILKFAKLRKLILQARMYTRGAEVLAKHPSLAALHGVQYLSYEVANVLADSRLSRQLTSLDFEPIQNGKPTAHIISQIARFTNLTHLGMHNMYTLGDGAMMELAPLVKLKQLYVHFSNISSEGLKVFHQLPQISVLSLGYCRNIKNGLEHIAHLNLTHLDLRSLEDIKTEHLLPVLHASHHLIDLNVRYARSVDAKALFNQADLSRLKFINVFSTAAYGSSLQLELNLVDTKFYEEDQCFYRVPAYDF